jgi:hypothetical protein
MGEVAEWDEALVLGWISASEWQSVLVLASPSPLP